MKKIIAVILCLIVMFSVFSCAKPDISDDENVTKPSTDIPSNTVAKLPYEDIISKYTALLNIRIKGETLTEPSKSATEIETVLYEIVRDTADPLTMGYATKDINGDGLDELVMLDKGNKLYALFTLKNNESILLMKMDSMAATITPNGIVYAGRYVKDTEEIVHVKRIVDGKLDGLEYGGIIDGENITYYKIENGERTEITRDEKLQLDNSIQGIMMRPQYYTKTTGFRFVSAVEKSVPSTAPIPNFTSYDGIISAYKTIVESFSEYKQSDWINGDFDSLFAITDNDTYDIFHEMFWGGIRKMPTETYFGQTYATDGDNSYGYAEKDLNGDGIEELILMNDNYEVFAIFTIKDGKAVLIDGTFGVWIDEKGLLRREIGTGGLVSRDGEVYVYVLDGTELKTEIAVGYKVNIYLQKEGWYKIEGGTKVNISAEEGEALYAVYDILPSYYCDEEYTRTFSGIEFIPLYEATLAGQKHINTYSNGWFVNGDTLTVSGFSKNDATASIKFVYTEGEFDPETNPNPKVYITELNIQAIRNESRYEFEKDGVKGYIEFAVNSAWVVVIESQNEHVLCRAYLFNYPEN